MPEPEYQRLDGSLFSTLTTMVFSPPNLALPVRSKENGE